MHPKRTGVSAAASPPAPTASVDIDVVRRRFNYEWTLDETNGVDADTYWWWCRSVRVDPSEIIADDDAGGLWSIPFSTDGEDDVTFGEPVRVRETYVPVAGDGVAATAMTERRRQRVLAADLARPTKPASPAHPRASTGPQGQEEEQMDLSALRSEFGIADDVTDDEITEVLEALGGSDDDDDSADASTVTEPDESATAPAAAAASTPASATEAENAALRATVERLAAQEADRATREAAAARAQVLDTAVREGRISYQERTSLWEPFYDANPSAATDQLSKLPANRFPVAELGHGTGAVNADDAEYDRMLATRGLNPKER